MLRLRMRAPGTSGTSTASAAQLRPLGRTQRRVMQSGASVAAAVFLGLSVNSHWLSAVVGGLAAGTGIALAVALIIDRRLLRTAAPATSARVALAARVETAELQTRPFDHIVMRDLFPPTYYAALVDRLPATKRYRELRHRQAILADGRSARRKFYLFPEHVMLLPGDQRAGAVPASAVAGVARCVQAPVPPRPRAPLR
jgi:hypothetical protein